VKGFEVERLITRSHRGITSALSTNKICDGVYPSMIKDVLL